MAGHTPWRAVKARRGPDTLERQAMRAAYRRAMEDALRLAEVRETRGITQVELGDALGVSQANISQLENREDLYLSSLRGYVEALGGRLVLLAVFPDQTMELASPGVERAEGENSAVTEEVLVLRVSGDQ
jgi:DNA-binding XRE family transcriptional regulator